MIFFSLLVALLIEQLRPLRHDNQIFLAYSQFARSLERHFNGSQYRHGVAAWMLAVLPAVLLVFAVHFLLYRMSPLLAWVWNIAILYLTMGFRQFSHYFTEIMRTLRDDNVTEARDYLGKWRKASAEEFNSGEIARVAIELGLTGSHRQVFGPIALFLVMGPAGALLYRLAALLNEEWGTRTDAEFGEFGRFAERFFYWLDWLPARLTALSFAIVGNFEDAVYCWRTQAQLWTRHAEGILLAAGAGALGVRLGDELHEYGSTYYRPEMGAGEAADVVYMHSTVGLIWRALVLWMFLVLLVTLARALG
jgi:adenosylcobinamide-phosphate synthase